MSTAETATGPACQQLGSPDARGKRRVTDRHSQNYLFWPGGPPAPADSNEMLNDFAEALNQPLEPHAFALDGILELTAFR